MMRNVPTILLSTGRLRLSVTVLLIVSLACAIQTTPNQDIHALGTAVMQTMIAGATQTAQGNIPVDLPDTPTATFTAIFPPAETLTPSPVFASTPIVSQVSVSVATNCRTGPGKVYDRVGALLVGQVADVVGRNSTGNYWYIRNPNQSGGFCWLWGEYATLTGNFAALPIFTPQPTPTPIPALEASYNSLDSCTVWWVNLDLTNNGGTSFESIAITMKDMDTGIVASMYMDVFEDLDGCAVSSSTDAFSPGATLIISGPGFDYSLRGHELRATITLCPRNGQDGTCITESIEFTP
jgi:hypothetical protein